jgi:hypothetical protein
MHKIGGDNLSQMTLTPIIRQFFQNRVAREAAQRERYDLSHSQIETLDIRCISHVYRTLTATAIF